MLSKETTDRLNHMVGAGYGWGKYAQNILNQGWASKLQESTIDRMFNKLVSLQNTAKYRRKSYRNNIYINHMGDNEGWGEAFETADYGGYE